VKRYSAVVLGLVAALCCQLASVSAYAAEDYPEKEIRLIVGFPPGSAIELSIRALVQVASKHFKKPLIVINRPGAAQSIAMGELVGATPDGYTIGMTTDGYKSMTVHTQKMRFDPKAIKFVLGYARFRHVLFVRSDLPYARYDDFIAFAKKAPGAVAYGGTGEGSTPDLIGRVFFRDVNVKPTYVPFKGSNEYIAAVLGGHLQSGVIDISGVRRQVQSGQLKLVVVFGDNRLEEFPDVPSSKEKGHSDLNLFNSVLSIVVHKDVPAERVAYLHDTFKKAVDDPEFAKLTNDMGLKALYTSPQALDAGVLKMEALGVPLLKELKLFVE
jgi:tripartite-type tricarboxylate transporter receptor subunit TctC